MLIAQASDIVIIGVVGRGHRTEAAPYTSMDAKWSLMAAATVSASAYAAYAVDLAFRCDLAVRWDAT